MTTSRSPLSAIKAQADAIAKGLKQMERGEAIVHDPGGRIAASRESGRVKFAIVMDDKVITIEVPWAKISNGTEAGISAWIVKYMQGFRDDAAH